MLVVWLDRFACGLERTLQLDTERGEPGRRGRGWVRSDRGRIGGGEQDAPRPPVDGAHGDLDRFADLVIGGIRVAVAHATDDTRRDFDLQARLAADNFTLDARARSNHVGVIAPGIGQRTLARKRDLLSALVDAQNVDRNALADRNDVGGLLDALESEFAHRNETVDSAEIDERTEIDQADNYAFAPLTRRERANELGPLRTTVFFERSPLRNNGAPAGRIEIQNLQRHLRLHE